MDLLQHHNHTEEEILPVDGKILLQIGCPTKSEIPPFVNLSEILMRLDRGGA